MERSGAPTQPTACQYALQQPNKEEQALTQDVARNSGSHEICPPGVVMSAPGADFLLTAAAGRNAEVEMPCGCSRCDRTFALFSPLASALLSRACEQEQDASNWGASRRVGPGRGKGRGFTSPLNWTWLTRLDADTLSLMPLPSTPLQIGVRSLTGFQGS